MEALPLIVGKLPAPAELESVQIGGDTTGLVGIVSQLAEIMEVVCGPRDS